MKRICANPELSEPALYDEDGFLIDPVPFYLFGIERSRELRLGDFAVALVKPPQNSVGAEYILGEGGAVSEARVVGGHAAANEPVEEAVIPARRAVGVQIVRGIVILEVTRCVVDGVGRCARPRR